MSTFNPAQQKRDSPSVIACAEATSYEPNTSEVMVLKSVRTVDLASEADDYPKEEQQVKRKVIQFATDRVTTNYIQE